MYFRGSYTPTLEGFWRSGVDPRAVLCPTLKEALELLPVPKL